jgi:type II secretory pathway pseudopilin PulG
MNYSLGGYTLIEALMVVAITSTIFIGVTTLFTGSRENVDFNQAKVDIDTKMKSYVNQVSTGAFAGSTTHRCSLAADSGGNQRTVLTLEAGGVTPGSSNKCIYLGKAILAYPGATKLYIYDVLGLRNKHSGAVDSGQPARSYEDSNPEPAGTSSGAGGFSYLFVEEYDLPADLRINYAQAGGTTANILKIYSSLNSNNSSSRGISVFANQFTATASDVSSARLRGCIHALSGGPCASVIELESIGWDLCIQNSGNTKRAKINIKPTATGVVTKVTDGVC